MKNNNEIRKEIESIQNQLGFGMSGIYEPERGTEAHHLWMVLREIQEILPLDEVLELYKDIAFEWHIDLTDTNQKNWAGCPITIKNIQYKVNIIREGYETAYLRNHSRFNVPFNELTSIRESEEINAENKPYFFNWLFDIHIVADGEDADEITMQDVKDNSEMLGEWERFLSCLEYSEEGYLTGCTNLMPVSSRNRLRKINPARIFM